MRGRLPGVAGLPEHGMQTLRRQVMEHHVNDGPRVVGFGLGWLLLVHQIPPPHGRAGLTLLGRAARSVSMLRRRRIAAPRLGSLHRRLRWLRPATSTLLASRRHGPTAQHDPRSYEIAVGLADGHGFHACRMSGMPRRRFPSLIGGRRQQPWSRTITVTRHCPSGVASIPHGFPPSRVVGPNRHARLR